MTENEQQTKEPEIKRRPKDSQVLQVNCRLSHASCAMAAVMAEFATRLAAQGMVALVGPELGGPNADYRPASCSLSFTR